MKTDAKQLDTLTRALMKGTTEKPSVAVMNRIMKQVEKERRATKNISVSSRPAMGWLIAGSAAYLLLLVGMGCLLLGAQDDAAGVASSLQGLFPLIVVVSAGASVFFCCTQLDRWQRWQRMAINNGSNGY